MKSESFVYNDFLNLFLPDKISFSSSVMVSKKVNILLSIIVTSYSIIYILYIKITKKNTITFKFSPYKKK